MTWNFTSLGYFIADGPTNGLYRPASDYGCDGTPIVRIDSFASGSIHGLSVLLRVHLSPLEIERYHLAPRDILINRVNSLSHIGKAAIVPTLSCQTVFESNMMRLRVNDEMLPEFLIRLLCSECANKHWLARAKPAVNQASLNQRDVKELRVPHLTLQEQQAIARILDAVDVAIERTRTAIAKAERLKRGLMQEVLKVRSQGKLPIHRLDKVAEIGSGVTLGRDLSGTATVDLPYLRVANVQDGFLDLDEIKTVKVRPSEIERFSLATGDVLLTEGGDFDKLGRGAVWTGEISPCLHQNHIFRVRADRTRLDPQFLATLIGSEYGKRFFLRIAKRTTNLASINKTQLSSFPVMLPSLTEQESIVSLLSGVTRVIESKKATNRHLEKLKRGLMQDLLTGRVRIKLPTLSSNGVVVQ